MAVDVESVSVALENLLKTMVADGDAKTVTRIWQPWEQLAEIAQPALVIVEPSENEEGRISARSKVTLQYQLICYLRVDNSPKAIVAPATIVNDFVKKIRTKLEPTGVDKVRYNSNTLGGLAADVSINGKITKEAGVLDEQASILIPITVTLP
jgi:hypothetical protein